MVLWPFGLKMRLTKYNSITNIVSSKPVTGISPKHANRTYSGKKISCVSVDTWLKYLPPYGNPPLGALGKQWRGIASRKSHKR